MATHLRACTAGAPYRSVHLLQRQGRVRTVKVRASSSSYLEMWKKAIERDRKTSLSQSNRIAAKNDGGAGEQDLEKKTREFQKLLEVSSEERDRVQRMQVIDRAAAAIAAARTILNDANSNSSANANAAPPNTDDAHRHPGIAELLLFLLFLSNLN